MSTKFNSFIILNFIISILAYSSPIISFAAISANQDYTVELDDIILDNPIPTKIPTLPLENNTTLPITFNASNYLLMSSSDTYAFSISQDNVDFGILSATNPVIRNSGIILNSPVQGAQVFVSQNRALASADNQKIADTTCDNGSCSEVIASEWTSSLTYGYGYRCELEDKFGCDNQTPSSETFKQFPDSSSGESYYPIIIVKQAKNPTLANIIYKLNISGTQPQKKYSNTITYIAVPNF